MDAFNPSMHIQLQPRKILVLLLSVFLVLLLAHIVSMIFWFALGHPSVFGFVQLFNFDDEVNFPSLFSGLCILLSSALLFLIAQIHKNEGSSHLSWTFLAAIFLFLAVDEVASIHEMAIEPLRNNLNATGVFYFAWILPYGLATLILGVSYLRFLIALPNKTMKLFLTAGGLYVGGAIGMEMVSGRYAEVHGLYNFPYGLLITIEESMEMIGLIIFVFALLSYISSQFPAFKLTVDDG